MPTHKTIIQTLSVAFIAVATTLSSTVTGAHWQFPVAVFSGLGGMWIWGYLIGESNNKLVSSLINEREYRKRLEESLIVANKAYDKEVNRAEEAKVGVEQAAGYARSLPEDSMDRVSVIFCNDSPELVVLSGMCLDEKIEQLATKHYERNKWNYIPVGAKEPSYEYYRQICYWHIHEVAVKA